MQLGLDRYKITFNASTLKKKVRSTFLPINKCHNTVYWIWSNTFCKKVNFFSFIISLDSERRGVRDPGASGILRSINDEEQEIAKNVIILNCL